MIPPLKYNTLHIQVLWLYNSVDVVRFLNLHPKNDMIESRNERNSICSYPDGKITIRLFEYDELMNKYWKREKEN